jgi:hypothetical protein
MSLNKKYIPLYLNELEKPYVEIQQLINKKKTFIVNGIDSIGKNTLIKLYLSINNYDFLELDNTITKEYFLDKISFKTQSVMSYFNEQKYCILIRHFDLLDKGMKELILSYSNNLFLIIISKSYLNFKINYIHIQPPSYEYLTELYINIFFIETNIIVTEIPFIKNFNELYTHLDLNINLSKNINCNESSKFSMYNIIYDDFQTVDINSLIKEKNFNNKVNMTYNLDNISVINSNLLYNVDSLDDIIQSYEYLLSAQHFNNQLYYNEERNIMEYFNILNVIGSTHTIDTEFKIYKTNFNIKKKNVYINYI